MGRFRRRLGMAAAVLAAPMLPACMSLTPRPLVDEYEPFAKPAPDLPSDRLTARFLGTSTVAISDGETTIMTDGFLSRPSLGRLLLRPVAPDRLRIEHALLKAGLTEVDAIFVAQSHHDHAMDTPYVAHLTGAKIVGSSSTRNIALGSGFRGKFERLWNGSTHKAGRFEVTVFQTPHSKPVPFPGEITEKLSRYAGVEEYREGGNFSFLIKHPSGRVLIVPSRGCWTGQFQGVVADVVFLGIGGKGTNPRLMRDHWAEAVLRTGARTVYPIHWDNFFRPLHKKLAPVLPGSLRKRKAVLEDLAAETGGAVAVIRPPLWDPIEIGNITGRGSRSEAPPLPSPPRRCGER